MKFKFRPEQALLKNGQIALLREAEVADALQILELMAEVYLTSPYLLFTPEESFRDIAAQSAWIRSFNQREDALLLVAEFDRQIIGMIDFAAQRPQKIRHCGFLGLNVHPAFQRQSVGRRLTFAMLSWAEKQDGLEKILLKVMDENKGAIELYRSIGFREEGRFTKEIRQLDGKYHDVIQMHLFLKENRSK